MLWNDQVLKVLYWKNSKANMAAHFLKCFKCKKDTFENKVAYRKHVQECFHLRKYPFTCFICMQGFRYVTYMNKHIRNVHIAKALKFDPTTKQIEVFKQWKVISIVFWNTKIKSTSETPIISAIISTTHPATTAPA